MATKRKAYTISPKLQAVAVAENTSKDAAARQFIVDKCRVRSRSVMLMASDNFGIAQIVRLLWTTMLITALYNSRPQQQPKYEY